MKQLWVALVLVVFAACDKNDGSGGGKTEGSSAGSAAAGSAVAGSAAEPPKPPPPPAATGSAAPPATTGSAATAPPPPPPPETGSGAGSGSAMAAGSGAGSGSAADAPLAVGDKVTAKWDDGYWYPGRITKIRDNGTYDVSYDDGDSSKALAANKVKRRIAKPKDPATGKKGGGCPSGLNMCSGRCVNQYTDRNNCFGCGRTCPEGYECRGGSCSTPL